MSQAIYVVGVGHTPFGRHASVALRTLAAQAVGEALADAGCAPERIDAAWFANVGQGALEDQHAVRGQIALQAAGLQGLPITNVENACASASTALHAAAQALRAGDGEVALAVGAEKMQVEDAARIRAVFDGCWDVAAVAQNLARLKHLGAAVVPADADPGIAARTVFMDVYAGLTRDHMARFGTTPRQLAAVAAKNHAHSVHNPLAQFRRAFSVDEVLAARTVVWPLTLPMCSAISDGAAAALLCTESALKHFDRRRAVRLAASVLACGRDRPVDRYDQHVCRLAAQRAYAQAGIGPHEVSVAEVHDASAFGEILQTENLDLCGIGQGGELAESGATTLGGRLPVNPSGGLESRGHPIGATGLAQIHELVLQLRGEAGPRQVAGARFGIAENGGGFLGVEEAAACITILARPGL
jgi:acetyl-CoA acetyltransferase